MARRTCRFFPVLRDINMIRSYAGLRPYTADQMPFLSRTGTEGLYVAAGHEGAGITLSLATGKFMDDLDLRGKPVDFEENLFSLDRFATEWAKGREVTAMYVKEHPILGAEEEGRTVRITVDDRELWVPEGRMIAAGAAGGGNPGKPLYLRAA